MAEPCITERERRIEVISGQRDRYSRECFEMKRELDALRARSLAAESGPVLVPSTPSIPHQCPSCNGVGWTSRPPQIPGDVKEWTSAGGESYACYACRGDGIVWGSPFAASHSVVGETRGFQTNERFPMPDDVVAHIAEIYALGEDDGSPDYLYRYTIQRLCASHAAVQARTPGKPNGAA